MSKVLEICISNKFKNKMFNVKSINAIAGKGIVNDRYYKKNNDKIKQITLIESENIDLYNKLSSENIHYIDFRRNIITKDIYLNRLINRKLSIGNSIIIGHQLCEPCLDLQLDLKQKELVKKLLHKGGLRAEIIKSGKIKINDSIQLID